VARSQDRQQPDGAQADDGHGVALRDAPALGAEEGRGEDVACDGARRRRESASLLLQ
jgi:hypothetical protein